jgi:hypothetical protein
VADVLKSVRTRLLSSTTVSTSVGSTRIYPQHAEQAAALPHIVLREIGNTTEHNLLGTSGTSETRVQIDCYALTYAAAYALREAARRIVGETYGTVEGLNFRSAVQGSRFGAYLEPRDGSDQGKHVLSVDFLLIHSETALTSGA